VALNSANQAVGYSDSALYEAAFLWQNGTVIALTSELPKKSGWSSLVQATGINDSGLIVGEGQPTSEAFHAFLLTPTIQAMSAAVRK
jgi:hypothetical protein